MEMTAICSEIHTKREHSRCGQRRIFKC